MGILSTLGLTGCGAQAMLSGGSVGQDVAADDAPGPEIALKTVYELEGDHREIIFLRADHLSDAEFDRVAGALAATLNVEVLPAGLAFREDPDVPALTPVDPETGAVGISLTLRGMTPTDPDKYEVHVAFARSGLDGGDLTLVLARQDSQWAVVEVFDGPQS